MWNLKAKKEQRMRPYRDAIAQRIAGYLMLLTGYIIKFLQRIDRRMPLTWKKMLFLAFVTASSAWCSYTFFRAVYPASKSPPVTFKSITIKKSIHK